MKYRTVEYLFNQLVSEYHISIIIFDKRNKIIYPHNLEKDLGDLNVQLLNHCKSDKITFINEYQKMYSVFSISIENHKNTVLIGPQYSMELNISEYVEGIITDKSIQKENMNQEIFFRNLSKFIFVLGNDRVPTQEIEIKKTNVHEVLPFNELFKKNLESRIIRDIENDSMEIERRIIQSIINNDIEEFNWLFNKVRTTYFARLHSDRLISLKYKYIGFITILTRSSLNNGVDFKKAYGLSDTLIQSLESIHRLQDCIIYFRESCLQFMKLINVSKYEGNGLTRSAKEYIEAHINQKITVKQLAEYLKVSNSYLSSEFKKNDGITIHAYILKSKIERAKVLLVETDIEISLIAQKLAFSDQSHFNRVFKRIEDITPKEYRKKYRSIRIL